MTKKHSSTLPFLQKNLALVNDTFLIDLFTFIHFFLQNQGKPKPDIYLELAKRLNVDKNSCIIFEDSVSGVRAAVAAGIKCIGVLTSAKRETLEGYGTWRTVKSFEEVNLDEIWSAIQSE